MSLLSRKKARSDNGTAKGPKRELGEKDCVSCGRHTDGTATVYMGKQVKDAGGAIRMEWRPYTRALCRGCVDEELDSRGFGTLIYAVLQVCWVPLFTHGLSPLGVGGALIACYGIYRLAQVAAEAIWMRSHAGEDATEMPAWIHGSENEEERASAALKELIREDVSDASLVVESAREHARRDSES